MIRFFAAALVFAAIVLPASAQEVRITFTDGNVLQGTLVGYGDGRYKFRMYDGSLHEIEDGRIQGVDLAGGEILGGPVIPGNAAATLARAALEQGDYATALRQILGARQALTKEIDQMNEAATSVAVAHVDQLMEKGDADAMAEALRPILPALPGNAARETMSRLAEDFATRLRAAPADGPSSALMSVLATLPEGTEPSLRLRTTLADHLARLARDHEDQKNHRVAARLYQTALKVEPERREALHPRMMQAFLIHVRRLLEDGNDREASRAAQEALALDPENEDVQRLIQDADFARLKVEVQKSYLLEARDLLKTFLDRSPRPEHRDWTERALADLERNEGVKFPGSPEALLKYFPIRPGRFLLYRRADGRTKEKVTTDSIEREGDAVRVYQTLEEIYGEYTTSQIQILDVRGDSLVNATGLSSEPILKLPLRPGEEWKWRTRDVEFRRRVRSMGDSVSLGDPGNPRIFDDCLVIEFTSTSEREGEPTSITSLSTYAAGLGLVKLEYLHPDLDDFSLEIIDSGLK